MATHGRISGRVTDSQNNGIPNVAVTVYDTIQNFLLINTTTTDWDGNYTVGQLPTMNARVLFDPGRSSPFNAEYNNNKVTFEMADPISVTAGQTINNVDAQLSARSITIREPDGGEKWCAGTSRSLMWTDTGTIANVKIEYSTDNGRSFITEAASTLNTGSYPWMVPQLGSSAVIIRVSDASNPADYDDSNGTITVSAGKCQIPAEFNFDGASDATVWRPSSGIWYTIMDYDTFDYSATPWGLNADIAVAGDYDGDGATDIAVFRPSTSIWYIRLSGTPGSYDARQWGLETDIPTPGDYDGDGKTDIAVFRPATGIWYVLLSGTPGSYTATYWGMNADIPVPADYDGDGKIDIAVWRPGSGVWYVLSSAVPGAYTATQWGMSSDIPVPADYDGDFKTDIAVWRPSTGTWYFVMSASLSGTYSSTTWGMTGDKPAVSDFDGDGKMDVAVWRPDTGTWYVLLSSDPGNYVSANWGMLNDQPITLLTRIVTQFP
jgi:hypothetical protein